VRLLVILVGLTAIITGIGGVFANLAYGEGHLALLGIGISLSTLTLGLIITYMGLSNTWSR
jgi:hypothetical protein